MDRYDHGLCPNFAIHCMMLDRHYHLIYEVMGPSIKYVVNKEGGGGSIIRQNLFEFDPDEMRM